MSHPQRYRWIRRTVALLLLLLLATAVAWPLLAMLQQALGGFPGALHATLAEPAIQESALRTIAVALLSCGLASLLAVPAALAGARAPLPLRRLMVAIGVLPLLVPPFYTAALFRELVTDLLAASAIGEPAGGRFDRASLELALVYAVHYMPLMLLTTLAGLRRVDPALLESARNLGARRWTAFRVVTLPLALPGFLLGAALLVLKVIEDVATPVTLGVEAMLAPRLMTGIRDGAQDPVIATLGLLLLVLSLLVTILAWSALAPPAAPRGNAGPAFPRSADRGRASGLFAVLLIGATASLPFVLATHGWHLNAAAEASVKTLRSLVTMTQGGPLQVAALSAVILLMLAVPTQVLLRSADAAAVATRVMLTLLFAVPWPLLAIAVSRLPAMAAPADPVVPGLPLTAGMLALAVLLAVKTLPLLPHLLRGWQAMIGPAHDELTRSIGAARSSVRLRQALPLPPALLLATLAFGLAVAFNEWSIPLLLGDAQATLASRLFDLTMAHGGPGDTAAIGLLLALVLLGVATLLPAVATFAALGRRRPPPPLRQPLADEDSA